MSLESFATELREMAREADDTGQALLARALRLIATEFSVPNGPTVGQVVTNVIDDAPSRGWWRGRKALGPG